MKILLVNKFLMPRGGCETYVFNIGRMLTEHGHEVQYFGMEHPDNIVGNRVGVYAPRINLQGSVIENLSAPFHIINSKAAGKKIREVLDDFQPDVVHFNNIEFYLTPSVIMATYRYCRETGRTVRMVMTAHDYQMVCPSHGLFDSEVRICEKCLGGHYWNCLRTKCLKHSYAKSALGVLDAYYWKARSVYQYLNTIICPSQFLKKKLDTDPILRTKTTALLNFSDPQTIRYQSEGYVLEFGKLVRDKGTLVALEAARKMPEVKFKFAGYGPAESAIRSVKNAEFLGFLTGEKLNEAIQKAAVSICPSECYENCPLSVIESEMNGTPVVGSRRGGIPELIDEGKTGELFEAGNADDLVRALNRILETEDSLKRYSQYCKSKEYMTPERYYQSLIRIYGASDEGI